MYYVQTLNHEQNMRETLEFSHGTDVIYLCYYP